MGKSKTWVEESSTMFSDSRVLEEVDCVLWAFNASTGNTERVQNRRALAWSFCWSSSLCCWVLPQLYGHINMPSVTVTRSSLWLKILFTVPDAYADNWWQDQCLLFLTSWTRCDLQCHSMGSSLEYFCCIRTCAYICLQLCWPSG